MNPSPFVLPSPPVSRENQLMSVANMLPAASDWANGVTFVRLPESTPLLAPMSCGATGFQAVSGDTVADGVANWDLTELATDAHQYTQLPFNIYRALRSTVLADVGMIGDEQIVKANAKMLERWISIAIAQEFVTGAASGGLSLLNSAAVISGVEDLDALGCAIDEYTQRAGAVSGLVHLPTGSSVPLQVATAGGINLGPRFTAVADAGYQNDFLRGRFTYGATKIAGFVTGPVYLGLFDGLSQLLEENMLTENIFEVLHQTSGIIIFDPTTVVSYISETVAAYTVA